MTRLILFAVLFLCLSGLLAQEIDQTPVDQNDQNEEEIVERNDEVETSETDEDPVLYLPVDDGSFQPFKLEHLAMELEEKEEHFEQQIMNHIARRPNVFKLNQVGQQFTVHLLEVLQLGVHRVEGLQVEFGNNQSAVLYQERQYMLEKARPASKPKQTLSKQVPPKQPASKPVKTASPKSSRQPNTKQAAASSQPCKNIAQNCQILIGHCGTENYENVMKTYCSEQCGHCPSTNCQDLSTSCATMKQQGFCENQNNYYTIEHKRIYCAKTCNLCAENARGGGSQDNGSNNGSNGTDSSDDGGQDDQAGTQDDNGKTGAKKPNGSRPSSNQHRPNSGSNGSHRPNSGSSNGAHRPPSSSNGAHRPPSSSNGAHRPNSDHRPPSSSSGAKKKPNSSHPPGRRPDNDDDDRKPTNGRKPTGSRPRPDNDDDDRKQPGSHPQPPKKQPTGSHPQPDKKPDNKQPPSSDDGKPKDPQPPKKQPEPKRPPPKQPEKPKPTQKPGWKWPWQRNEETGKIEELEQKAQ
ncbi:hypothetical protein M3Y97_00693200 [Aphelenchoides bicaudatus]|nr:hypothetical protein M3Y97_00693200 [Aphelenchoides bicaudatus]